MTKLEKYLTMSVAAVGALTGGMATYTDYTGAEFKKPIDLRQATVASFLAQIDSASKRRDHREALRVRLEYERFEESWRNKYSAQCQYRPVFGVPDPGHSGQRLPGHGRLSERQQVLQARRVERTERPEHPCLARVGAAG